VKEQVKEFITCSCGTEGVYIVKYKGEEETYLSMFSRGINPVKTSFLQKIRYIWKLIKTGTPYEDELVLNKKDLKKLLVVLNKCISK